MNVQDCYRILQAPQGAGLDEVKSAFRKQAFRLHPDLNPSPRAAEEFRRLNEAYVLLSHTLRDGDARAGGRAQGRAQQEAKAEKGQKAKAEKAYAKQKAAAGPSGGPSASGAKGGGGFYFREEEVLRDLLSDPFARQVFEDIYSQLKTGKPGAGASFQAQGQAQGQTQGQARSGPQPGPFSFQPRPKAEPAQPEPKRRRLNIQWGEKSIDLDMTGGLVGGIKGWVRGQLDSEETVHYPAHALGPGRTLRLTVSSRFGEPKTVEITLPQDFVVGRPIRLKGLGRKLGPFTGDLILRVLAR